MWTTSWILKWQAMCDSQLPPMWCVHCRDFRSSYRSSFLEVIETLLCLPVATEMMATSVLLGGDGPTIPFSLVVTSRHFLSHISRLAAALTEVMMS